MRSLQSETPQALAGTANWMLTHRLLVGRQSIGRVFLYSTIATDRRRRRRGADDCGCSWRPRGHVERRRSDAIRSPGPLFRVSAVGGQPVEATTLSPSQTSHRYPQFLVDGRRFFFYVTGTPDVRGVYAGSLDSKETRRLVDADTGGVFAPPDFVLFVRQATLYAQQVDLNTLALNGDPFVVAENVEGEAWLACTCRFAGRDVGVPGIGRGTERQLTWFDRAGKMLGTLGDPDRAGSMSAPVSRRMVDTWRLVAPSMETETCG